MTLDEFAAGDIDATDTAVLARLAGQWAASDPVPAGLVDRIRFGLTLDALEAEVAELQRHDALAGVRGDEVAETQTVTFTSASVTTMVTITPTSSDRVRIDGWAAPGAGAEVQVRTLGATVHDLADEDGRFVFEDVPRGPARFVVRPAGAPRPVVTPSIEL